MSGYRGSTYCLEMAHELTFTVGNFENLNDIRRRLQLEPYSPEEYVDIMVKGFERRNQIEPPTKKWGDDSTPSGRILRGLLPPPKSPHIITIHVGKDDMHKDIREITEEYRSSHPEENESVWSRMFKKLLAR